MIKSATTLFKQRLVPYTSALSWTLRPLNMHPRSMLYVFIFTLVLHFKIHLVYLCMAKEVKEIKVKYRSGIQHKGDINGEPYVEYSYDYISASLKSTKRYNTAICLLMGINGCAHHLIDWLSDNMTDGGYVSNNKITRNSFISFHKQYKKADNKEYSEHAVIKAFGKLVDEGFLISISKGTFQINPLMHFSASEDDRVRSIKYMMEFKAGLETKFSVEVNRK